MTAAGQTEWLTAGATWLLIGIFAAIILGVQLGKAIRAAWIRTGQRLDADLPRLLDHPIRYHCRANGHSYQAHQTVWLCGVCGDRIPRNTIEETTA